MKIFDTLATEIANLFHATVESCFDIETIDDEHTLVASDGSLVSIIRIHGLYRLAGDAEYLRMLEDSKGPLGALFERPGQHLQFFFEFDPDRSAREVARLYRPARMAAEAVGLDFDDIIAERALVLTPHLAHELCCAVLWTTPNALTAVAKKQSEKRRRAEPWPHAPDAQNPTAAAHELRSRHRSKRLALAHLFTDLSIKHELLDAHTAVATIRGALYTHLNTTSFRASLPGDPVPPRAPRTPNPGSDYSDVLWPPLRRQVLTIPGQVLGANKFRFGRTKLQFGPITYTGVDMVLGPKRPQTFPSLLARLRETGTPFRASFLLTSGSAGAMGAKQMLAGLLGFTNPYTKIIAKTLSAAAERARIETWVKYQISFATWAPAADDDLLDRRVAELVEAMDAWGECQGSPDTGDPLEGVLSSALGMHARSTAPAGLSPLHDIMTMLPLQRPTSPWTAGAAIFRTHDGRPFPVQLAAANMATWIDVFLGTSGRGKSMLLAALNFALVLNAGATQLPFEAIIDIGDTSLGIIDLIRDRLPAHQRHYVQHIKFQMTSEFTINLFDTPLGMRHPLPDHKALLVSLVLDIVTPPGRQPYDAMPQFVSLVIDEMYRRLSDTESGAEPKRYYPNIEPVVDAAIRTHGIDLDTKPLWWEVVDALFDAGNHHAASIAQRHAGPQLAEATAAAHSENILDLARQKQLGAGSTEPLTAAFNFAITAAINEFPIFDGITKFDIGADTRICAIDLAAVAPDGDEIAKRQSSIMYLVATHVTTRHWRLDSLAPKVAPARYREYYAVKVAGLRHHAKRLSIDEYARAPLGSGFRAFINRGALEFRKDGVQLAIATQLYAHLDPTLTKSITALYLCGAASADEELASITAHRTLSAAARRIFREHLHGPKPGYGAPFLLLIITSDGDYEQFLVNTMGALEIWAISTTPEDVAIRTQVVAALGSKAGLRTLAICYPHGSAKTDVKKREVRRAENGILGDAARGSVLDEVAQEIIDTAQAALRERMRAAIAPLSPSETSET
jgi:intracellular multiplication protein IcmB